MGAGVMADHMAEFAGPAFAVMEPGEVLGLLQYGHICLSVWNVLREVPNWENAQQAPVIPRSIEGHLPHSRAKLPCLLADRCHETIKATSSGAALFWQACSPNAQKTGKPKCGSQGETGQMLNNCKGAHACKCSQR